MLQFLALLISTTLGFAAAPLLPTILAVATLLTAFEISEDRATATRFSKLGGTRVLSLAIVLSALSSLMIAAFSFFVGRAIAALVSGLL
jgi:hypothetical protein